jgi:hypothetical protein
MTKYESDCVASTVEVVSDELEENGRVVIEVLS